MVKLPICVDSAFAIILFPISKYLADFLIHNYGRLVQTLQLLSVSVHNISIICYCAWSQAYYANFLI